jgi:putative ABC transport system substrate-binding protein
MNRAHVGVKLISLLAALSLLLAACGPGPSGEATPTPAGSTPGATAPAGSTPGPANTATTAKPTATKAAKKQYVVGILQTTTHPALDFTREGIKAAFIDAGFKEGDTVRFDYRNAEGDVPTARSLAQKFVADKVDAIITIGTPASQAALAATQDTKTIPVFFSAVADPYGAGLAGKKEGDTVTPDPASHPDNVTGVQAFPPVEAGMKLIQEVVPQAKTIGLLWNPSEPNSLATTLEARKVAGNLNLIVVEEPVAKPADAAAAAASFANKNIDAFFVSTTNSVVAGLDAVVAEARRTKKPLFGNDPLSAARGAVAAEGLDYTENGRQTGDLAVRVLTGKANIKTTDIAQTTKESLCVNTAAAADQGVTLPQALLDRAKACTYTTVTSPVPSGGTTPAAATATP